MTTYGYARVSSSDQNEARQIIALKEAGCDQIFLDKQSGKDFDRPEYKKMLRKLKEGDALFIHSLDRLGRNYELIKEQWGYIAKKKGCDIVVLDMPLLDTRQDKNLIGKFISDIVIGILAFVSQTERENIRKRQAEGIAAAKARGVRFGHEPKKMPDNFHDIVYQWYNGLITVSDGARQCGVGRATFRRHCNQFINPTGGVNE